MIHLLGTVLTCKWSDLTLGAVIAGWIYVILVRCIISVWMFDLHNHDFTYAYRWRKNWMASPWEKQMMTILSHCAGRAGSLSKVYRMSSNISNLLHWALPRGGMANLSLRSPQNHILSSQLVLQNSLYFLLFHETRCLLFSLFFTHLVMVFGVVKRQCLFGGSKWHRSRSARC